MIVCLASYCTSILYRPNVYLTYYIGGYQACIKILTNSHGQHVILGRGKSLPLSKGSFVQTVWIGENFESLMPPFVYLPSSLDRTNFVQDILSKYMLEQYLRGISDQWSTAFSLWTSHREMWAENGGCRFADMNKLCL